MIDTGPFTQRPIQRFRLSLGRAVAISLALHLLLVSWLHYGGAAGLLLIPAGPNALVASANMASRRPVPLQFTFVDVPDDQAVPENPRARLLSDKTRMARQPVPTPPDAKNLGPDPHSEGNSKIRQVARLGPPQNPAPAGGASRMAPSQATPPPATGNPTAAGGSGARPTDEGLEPAPEGEGGAGDESKPAGQEEGASGQDRKAAFEKAIRQLQAGTYDFSNFDNPSYMQGNNYGTLSFDTKGFDWGDYARQIYLIIKKNWYDRIPIAAYYGQKGKVFIRFVIEKNGSITDLAVIRSSEISPFDRAAENAIRASNPLPPLPAKFPNPREGVTFGFYYNLPIDEP
jgi:TonB family protein